MSDKKHPQENFERVLTDADPDDVLMGEYTKGGGDVVVQGVACGMGLAWGRYAPSFEEMDEDEPLMTEDIFITEIQTQDGSEYTFTWRYDSVLHLVSNGLQYLARTSGLEGLDEQQSE